MVKATSTTTDVPNIEHMDIYGNDDSGTHFTTCLMREDLTTEEQTIYDDAIALFADNRETNIDNTLSEFWIERMTSTVVDFEATEDVDYATMNETDKDKLRAFLAMVLANKDV
jgi:hypothetical protein